MEKFVRASEKLKNIGYLGIIGFFGSIYNIPLLRWFHIFIIFFIFGLVKPLYWKGQNSETEEQAYKVKEYAKKEYEDAVLKQSLVQLWGMVYTPLKHIFRMPSINNRKAKINYILPFTGKWVVVNGGFTKKHSHSWWIFTQRYAYDFIQMDDSGNYAHGDKTKLESYLCYGKGIIAPADGVVVETQNNYNDSRVDGKNAYCDAPDMRGNFITIRHSLHEYSVIAHLAPRSITVKAGETVMQGQVIAKCGNSGNTSMPHVHFQLQTTRNFFTAAGLPIAFSNITAEPKTNYGLLDPRNCGDNIMMMDDEIYIARGLEVGNVSISYLQKGFPKN